MINFLDSWGTFTGKTLPTSNPIDTVRLMDGRKFEVSIVDCVNVVVMVKAQDFGLQGIELNNEINANRELLHVLEEIRIESGIMIGLIKEEDRENINQTTHALPKIAMVSAPSEYMTNDHKFIKKKKSILLRVIFQWDHCIELMLLVEQLLFLLHQKFQGPSQISSFLQWDLVLGSDTLQEFYMLKQQLRGRETIGLSPELLSEGQQEG